LGPLITPFHGVQEMVYEEGEKVITGNREEKWNTRSLFPLLALLGKLKNFSESAGRPFFWLERGRGFLRKRRGLREGKKKG